MDLIPISVECDIKLTINFNNLESSLRLNIVFVWTQAQ